MERQTGRQRQIGKDSTDEPLPTEASAGAGMVYLTTTTPALHGLFARRSHPLLPTLVMTSRTRGRRPGKSQHMHRLSERRSDALVPTKDLTVSHDRLLHTSTEHPETASSPTGYQRSAAPDSRANTARPRPSLISNNWWQRINELPGGTPITAAPYMRHAFGGPLEHHNHERCWST